MGLGLEERRNEKPRGQDETGENSIEKLKGSVSRLSALLNDPQPGLATWQEAMKRAAVETRAEINRIFGAEKAEK